MDMTPDKLPMAVIGCGRMGRLHAKTLRQMEGVEFLGVYDPDRDRASAVAGEMGVAAFSELEPLLDRASAVVIATSTFAHLSAAEPFLRRGIACLIEKPLASTTQQAQQIIALADQYGALVQVGHIERFNPAVRAAKKLGLSPGFIEAIRVSPLPFRSMDVGVVMDIMIHDIDLAMHLTGSTPTSVDAFGGKLLGQVEDICSARVHFASGSVANLTASRLAMKPDRKLRLFARDCYVSLDLQKRQGVIAHGSKNLPKIKEAIERFGQSPGQPAPNFAELVNWEPLQVEEADPLTAQAQSFVQSIQTRSAAITTAREGLEAIELASRITSAIV